MEKGYVDLDGYSTKQSPPDGSSRSRSRAGAAYLYCLETIAESCKNSLTTR